MICGMAFLCLAAGWMFLYVHADVLFRIHVNKILPQLDQVVPIINIKTTNKYPWDVSYIYSTQGKWIS